MNNTEAGFHVTPQLPSSGWAVVVNGKVVSTHRAKGYAIYAAQKLAKRHGQSYTIHSRTGDVIATKSYEIKPY